MTRISDVPWLAEAYSRFNEPLSDDDRLDAVADMVDKAMACGDILDFVRLDLIIAYMADGDGGEAWGRVNNDMAMTWLTATFAAKDKLTARPRLLERMRERLTKAIGSDEADILLSGLQ